MKKLTKKITQFIENFKNVHAEARKIGFVGTMRLLWKDLFVGRSLFQWLYLIVLSSVPLILEFTQNTESHDWIDRKSTRLNSSHIPLSRMPSSA